MKTVKAAINAQWQTRINSGCLPVMEWKMSNGDWLMVDIEYKGDYFLFSFDQDNKPVFFDGCIKGQDNFYHYPIDECFDSFDYYLQEIAGNIIEGYLIPNGLYACEGE